MVAMSQTSHRHSHWPMRSVMQIALTLLCCVMLPYISKAQFFKDTTERGRTKRLWLASHVMPGYGQVVNKQYWKLPVYYAGMGGMVYLGIRSNKLYETHKSAFYSSGLEHDEQLYVHHRLVRNLSFATAGAIYASGIIDGLVVRNTNVHSPTTATIMSLLIPGAGQYYNKQYYKIPIIYAGGAALYYGLKWNNKMYNMFREALVASSNGETVPSWARNRGIDNLDYYTNMYHRNRDLCALGFALLYIANILDANVHAHLFTWDVSTDLSFNLAPAPIPTNSPTNGIGVGLALNINLK